MDTCVCVCLRCVACRSRWVGVCTNLPTNRTHACCLQITNTVPLLPTLVCLMVTQPLWDCIKGSAGLILRNHAQSRQMTDCIVTAVAPSVARVYSAHHFFVIPPNLEQRICRAMLACCTLFVLQSVHLPASLYAGTLYGTAHSSPYYAQPTTTS